MEKSYRIFSKVEAPLKSHSDFNSPKAIYTLVQNDGQLIRTSLPRRSAGWEVGDVVKIEEAVVLVNVIDGE